MPNDPSLSRRGLLIAGAAGFASVAAAGTGDAAGAQERLPPPQPIDTGQVQPGPQGRPSVNFPQIGGEADPPAQQPRNPRPDNERVGFAVVGLGRLTLEELLPAFGETERAKVVAVVSGSPDKARVVARQQNLPDDAIYGYDDWERIRTDRRIQAVYVVTPNGLHRRDVLNAARAGKHVLCEKPMANTSREAREMIAACERARVKLMIAYRCQYEKHNREAIRLFRSGELGDGRLIQAVNTQIQGDPSQWRLRRALAGGGSLPDIGLYCLNSSRALTGEEPEEVFARIWNTPNDPRFREVEDNVAFTLRFPSGVMSTCSTSYSAFNSKDLAFQSTRGRVHLADAFAYRGQELHRFAREGEQAVERIPNIEMRNQFALEIDHFARCVQEDVRPRTPGEEGLQDHLVMEALYESARTGRPVRMRPPETRDAFRGPEPEDD